MKRFDYLLLRESQECIGFYPGCASESPGWGPGTWGSVFAAVHSGLRTSTLRNLSILWKLFLVSLSSIRSILKILEPAIWSIYAELPSSPNKHMERPYSWRMGKRAFFLRKGKHLKLPTHVPLFSWFFFRQYDMFRPCMKKLIMITLETRKRGMGLSLPSTQR